jgi:hypothetical protein
MCDWLMELLLMEERSQLVQEVEELMWEKLARTQMQDVEEVSRNEHVLNRGKD